MGMGATDFAHIASRKGLVCVVDFAGCELGNFPAHWLVIAFLRLQPLWHHRSLYAQKGEVDVQRLIGIWLCPESCARAVFHICFHSCQSLKTVSGAVWLRAMNSGK